MVTSNANLNEFSISALTEYLALSCELLADDGIFFFQCPGWNHDGRDVMRFLYEAGFAPLFLAQGNVELQLADPDRRPLGAVCGRSIRNSRCPTVC